MVRKIVCFMFTFLLTVGVKYEAYAAVAAGDSLITEDFRAVWVATVANLDFPSKKDLSNDALKKEIDFIISKTAEMNLNAIILQVRPSGDALYDSSIFPWSEYLTGVQGNAPADGFDPLAYWVANAHANGLELHAWINPYRITHTSSGVADVSKLAAGNPARKNPSLAVAYKNALYYDPGLPESKKLIIDGVIEIIDKYEVDGIHLDDYFYPAQDFPDDSTYAKYGAGKTRDDWRRENVNDVVKGIQKAIAERKPEVRYGISPFAIWQNIASDPLGSETKGNEAYKYMYADTRRWVKEGWLDYICPQIYWYSGFEVADYLKLVKWWAGVCEGTGVDLYVGHAAYREDLEEAPVWKGEIVRQLEYNEATYPEIIKGSVFFRFNSLKADVGMQIKEFYSRKAPAAATEVPPVKMAQLSVVQPSKDFTTSENGFNFFGACVPGEELYINGQLVGNRTSEGFFSVYAALDMGANKFVFSQEGQTDIVRTITRNAPKPPTSTQWKEPAAVPVDKSSLTYATVSADTAWAYNSPSITPGSDNLLLKWQRDAVIATAGDDKWVKLSSGVWVEKKDVTVSKEDKLINNTLSNGKYSIDGNIHSIKWNASHYPVLNTVFDGKTLTVYFGLHTVAPGFAVPDGIKGDVFYKSVESGTKDGTAYYTFTVKDNVDVEGYYAVFQGGEFAINIRKRRALSPGTEPLSGFKFVLDAGHGNDDYGALGPMGRALAEKDINLSNVNRLAEKLKSLGAEVVSVRSADEFYSLQERVDISRGAAPDMFISMHANSVAETTDATSIHGITFWYRNTGSKPLADHLSAEAHDVNPMTTRKIFVYQSNFYVCRPSWCPSVLIETSFMCNIQDFAWMINPAKQEELANRLTIAILSYYVK